MGKIKQFTIELENTSGIFHHGNSVSGKVVLIVEDDLKLRSKLKEIYFVVTENINLYIYIGSEINSISRAFFFKVVYFTECFHVCDIKRTSLNIINL